MAKSMDGMTAISIHAPLAGCDGLILCAGGRLQISIHAPLAGCDRLWLLISYFCSHFNPRTPCGVRLSKRARIAAAAGFQSTHPLRGATL